MKTVLTKLRGELIVTKHVDVLCVKVLYGRGTGEKSIISEATVQVVWQTCQLVSLAVQRTGVVSPSVVKHLF
jgi:hypothetical protein